MISNELKEKVFDDVKQKITHFNFPQQQAWVVNANSVCAIIGRAGGKTHGFIAPAALRNVKGMPRGATGLVGPTYIKLENDLIPALRKALEKFGFYEGVDYWIKESIPKNITHADPFEKPENPKYSIFWKNGHIFRLLGLDRKDSGNAQSNDHIIGDEAKFIKQEAFNNRIEPTNRGNEDVFGNLHYHHGIMLCSDMPTSPESQWIFSYEQMMDQDQIDLIVTYDFARQELINQMADDIIEKNPGINRNIKFDKEILLEKMRDLVIKGQLTQALDKRFRKELQRLDGLLYELRREAVHFIEASTLDNIDVVTERYLRLLKRSLMPHVFDAAVLGIRRKGADFAFYGTFDELKHTYVKVNYSYTDNYKLNEELPQPWRKDADLDTTRGFDMGCDWGVKINCVSIGQEHRKEYRVVNWLYVTKPQRIKHLAKAIDDYYRGYPSRRIRHFYDHTAIAEDGIDDKSYYKEFAKELTELGWYVENIYIGKAANHDLKYKDMLKWFAEDDSEEKPIRINRNNCENLKTSIENAGVIEEMYEGKKRIKKDKRPEKLPSVKPEHATHGSDSFDTLINGAFGNPMGYGGYEPGYMT